MEAILFNGSIDDDADDNTRLASLENIKNIIQNIALCHAQEISKETKSVVTNKRKFNVVKVAQDLVSLTLLRNIDQSIVDENVKTIEDTLTRIMDSSILVKDQAIGELVPLAYETLRLIFLLTNEQFRQHFFHELIELYYLELIENLKNSSVSISFDKEYFDQQVKVLLPVIKLETALQLANDKDKKTQEHLSEIISNLLSFFENPRLNKEDIYLIISNKLNSKNFELLSYKMVPLDARNGHLGDYFSLKINIKYKTSDMVFNLFAKFLTPKLESMKELLKAGPSKKEDFFYMTFLPLLKHHGMESLLDSAPNCYLSRLNDVLVLDDMGAQGFTALTPNIKVEFEGLMFVVKQIAKLHSCSMIMEEILSEKEGKKVTLYDMYAEYLQEVIFAPDESSSLKVTLNTALNIMLSLAQKCPELYPKFTQDEFIEKINTGWTLLFEQVKKSEKFKNTICHGDMYVGNMLFKFDTNGVCVGAMLVDFQILRYCPPVQDLLFFIHQNSYKETRDKYYRELLDGYYSELTKSLQNFDLDIATIYPKEEFEESVKYMKSQAVFLALFYSPFNALEPSFREALSQSSELLDKYYSGNGKALLDFGFENDNYKRIMKGLIADVVDLCESGLL